jgi:hypothetical protein
MWRISSPQTQMARMQRNTADDHIRLIKAALTRTFP